MFTLGTGIRFAAKWLVRRGSPQQLSSAATSTTGKAYHVGYTKEKLPIGLKIDQAERDDFNTVIEWTAREEWIPGLNDAECFYATDSKALWIARLDGNAAAFMFLNTYQPNLAHLGCYIVRPDLRNRGIGSTLEMKVIDSSRATTVGCDISHKAIIHHMEEKYGFAEAFRFVEYSGVPSIKRFSRDGIVPIDTTMWDAIAAYDRDVFQAERESFLSAWLSSPKHMARAAIEGDQVTGYGVIRPCHGGVYRVGPLFADNVETAERIFKALVTGMNSARVLLIVPESNLFSIELCRRCGLEFTWPIVRMYRGPRPLLPLHKIFGITTLQLG